VSMIQFEGGPLAGQMAPDPDAPPMEEQAPEQSGADLVKMQEEKEQQDAMGGKLSPGILRKLGG
jgi:hypothetical protein